MDQAKRSTPPARTTYDGWVRLWEIIYGCRWPGRDRDAAEWLAAYLDWQHDQ
ncbi:MAG TPA: hypothetical protein VFE37_14980 [Chloroflexota bacterium]|nr:hypothetical protein [Chloroflexota bacterium]